MNDKLTCSECRKPRFTASYSKTYRRILCDDCFTDISDAIEDERLQANIDTCYSNGEQDG